MRNVVAVVVAVVLLALLWVAMMRGVRVEVENVGPSEITDVVVKVSGDTRELGTIAPGAATSVKLSPEGTTKRVEVTWKVDGKEAYGRHELIFEDSGYNGTIRFVLDGVSVKEAADDLETGFF